MRKASRIGGAREGAGRPRGEPTTVVRLPLPVAKLAQGIASGRFRSGNVSAFLDVHGRKAASVPLMASRAPCGFPSPADDYLDRPLDFNELLIVNPAATFAVRASGDSMIGAGIFPNDIAVVDRSVTPTNGVIILALIDNEFTIKRYCKKGARITLRAENPKYEDITVTEDTAFEVWGVITHSIRVL